MLKKMRWRFIWSAMAAIFAVLLMIVIGINVLNYHFVVQRQDAILEGLMERELNKDAFVQEQRSGENPLGGSRHNEDRHDGKDRRPSGDMPMPGMFGGPSPEFRYTLRYFVVHCDASGKAVATDRDFIASVTHDEAEAWAEKVVKSSKASGYLNGYRYLNRTTLDGWVVLFLNSEVSIQTIRTTLLVSSVVALVSLLLVFALLVLFSKRAIAPYVRNIETQKRFITDAGHELKTPLTAISTSADLLAEDVPDNEWVANIQTECVRMTRLVGDLVTLSRLDEAQPFPERAEFSFSDAVWELAEPAASLAKAGGKAWEQFIADGLTVVGDRAAIQQTVSILLDNALKYCAERGVIRLAAKEVRGKVQLTVFNSCDTTGIDFSRLFDRFYRPDISRSAHTGGTGIGLSVAKATVERHGGSITAKAQDDGILFTVRL